MLCRLREQQAKQREAEDATFESMGRKGGKGTGAAASARKGPKRGAAAELGRAKALAWDADDEMAAMTLSRRTQGRAQGARSQLARARASAVAPDTLGTATASMATASTLALAQEQVQVPSARPGHTAPDEVTTQTQAGKHARPRQGGVGAAQASAGSSAAPGHARKAGGRKRNRAAAEIMVD